MIDGRIGLSVSAKRCRKGKGVHMYRKWNDGMTVSCLESCLRLTEEINARILLHLMALDDGLTVRHLDREKDSHTR